ncbi:MAG: carboxypeptidase-like regulatory domain-containing protein, partial [Muribaculaceae bacterium]|nr:carboxypeptidase-like regulatory domain-containing protein [Muribaculaceae bacterium]
EWNAVKGANAYRVDLYRRHISNGFESYDVINENFDGIKVGTTDLDRPRAMSEDGYDRLDAYTKQPGWEVFQGFYVDGAVGILGYWNMLGVGCYMRSPEFDLSGNDGKMTMNIKVGSDYYNQGATIYLAHENKETGAIVYDEMFPMDEMEKGFHQFTTQFTKGRKDSFFVFYPYGYGLSYFDDIRVSQQLPAGESVIKVSSRNANGTSVSMTVPDYVEGDEYFYTVTALWIDNNDILKVESAPSAENKLEGLVKTTVFSGKVTDADGNGVANATVRLVNNASPDKIVSATTNRWGLFRVENIGDFESSFTPLASAPGYLTGMASTVSFKNGEAVEDVELRLRPSNSENEVEVGIPTRYAGAGAVYLALNNSESETLYPASVLGLPSNAIITAISYDGYCDTAKDVNYKMEVYLQNTEDEEVGEGATPKDEMELFASDTKKIIKGGSQELPVELMRFENQGGFKYGGKNLRVLTSSRSNKSNNSIYFLMDATQPNSSVYRYWGSSESNNWKVNAAGMPMMRIEYGLDMSGVDGFDANNGNDYGVKATGGEGTIAFEASAPCAVKIYVPSGMCVGTVALEAGKTVVSGFAPGIYIVAGNKIIVK